MRAPSEHAYNRRTRRPRRPTFPGIEDMPPSNHRPAFRICIRYRMRRCRCRRGRSGKGGRRHTGAATLLPTNACCPVACRRECAGFTKRPFRRRDGPGGRRQTRVTRRAVRRRRQAIARKDASISVALARFRPQRARLHLRDPAHWSKMLVRGELDAQGSLTDQRQVQDRRAARLRLRLRRDRFLSAGRAARPARQFPAARKLPRFRRRRLGLSPWPPAHRLGRNGRPVLRRRRLGQGSARIHPARISTCCASRNGPRAPNTSRAISTQKRSGSRCRATTTSASPARNSFRRCLRRRPASRRFSTTSSFPSARSSNTQLRPAAVDAQNGWDMSGFYYRSMDAQPTFYRQIVVGPAAGVCVSGASRPHRPVRRHARQGSRHRGVQGRGRLYATAAATTCCDRTTTTASSAEHARHCRRARLRAARRHAAEPAAVRRARSSTTTPTSSPSGTSRDSACC